MSLGHICEMCGRDMPERYERGGLMVMSAPPCAFWKGVRFSLTKTEVMLLKALIVDERLSYETIEYRIFPDLLSARNSAQVHIYNLRRRLLAAGCPHKIVLDHGKGYHFELDEAYRPPVTGAPSGPRNPVAPKGLRFWEDDAVTPTMLLGR